MAGSLLSMLVPSRSADATPLSGGDLVNGSASAEPSVKEILPQTVQFAKTAENGKSAQLPLFENMLGAAEKLLMPAQDSPILQKTVDNIKVRVGEGDFSLVPIPVVEDSWLKSVAGDEIVAVALPEIKEIEIVQVAQIAVFEPVLSADVVDENIPQIIPQNGDLQGQQDKDSVAIPMLESLPQSEEVAPSLAAFMETITAKTSPSLNNESDDLSLEISAGMVGDNAGNNVAADSQSGALAYEFVQEIADELNMDVELLPASIYSESADVKPKQEILLAENIDASVSDKKLEIKLDDVAPLSAEAKDVFSKEIDVESVVIDKDAGYVKPVYKADIAVKEIIANDFALDKPIIDAIDNVESKPVAASEFIPLVKNDGDVIAGAEVPVTENIDVKKPSKDAIIKPQTLQDIPKQVGASVVTDDVEIVEDIDVAKVAERQSNAPEKQAVADIAKNIVNEAVMPALAAGVPNMVENKIADAVKEQVAVVRENVADKMMGAANKIVTDMPVESEATKIVEDLGRDNRPAERFDARDAALKSPITTMPKGGESFEAKLMDMPLLNLVAPDSSMVDDEAMMIGGNGEGRLSNLRGSEVSDAQTRLFNAPEQLPVHDQIRVNIKQAIAQGTDEITIRLHPAELGRVDVKMEINADGKNTVIIMVEKAETLDMLQKDSRSLQQALADAGLDVETGGLQFSMSGDGEAGGESQAQEDSANAASSYAEVQETVEGADVADVAEIVDGDEYTLVASDGLDIKV